MEYAPSSDPLNLRILTMNETRRTLTPEQDTSLEKAFRLFGFHARKSGQKERLSRRDVTNVIQSITDEVPSQELVDSVMKKFCKDSEWMTLPEFRYMASSGMLQPRSGGRYWVALSLAEAETIRRVVHVRKNSAVLVDNCTTEVALRYSLVSGQDASSAALGGIVFDASLNWRQRKQGTGAVAPPSYEALMVQASFRFFDCDMHYPRPALHILVRELAGTSREKEAFFQSVIGCRRRMEIKVSELFALIQTTLFNPCLCILLVARNTISPRVPDRPRMDRSQAKGTVSIHQRSPQR